MAPTAPEWELTMSEQSFVCRGCKKPMPDGPCAADCWLRSEAGAAALKACRSARKRVHDALQEAQVSADAEREREDWPDEKQERCIHDTTRLCTCSAPQSCRFAPAPAPVEKRGRTEQVLATRRTGKTDELARRVTGCGCGVVYRAILKRPTAWQASDYQLAMPEEAAEHLAQEGRYVTAHVIGGGRVVSCRYAAGKLRLELAGTMIDDVVLEVRRRP